MTQKYLSIWWKPELGWVVDVPTGISVRAMEHIRQYVLKVQSERLIGIGVGDKKDECFRTIQDLHAGRMQQRIVETDDGVMNLFSSTEKVGTTEYSFPRG